MVDTIRTKADLLALLLDNTTGGINPQVHRDQVVSSVSQMGQLYTFETALETSILTQNVWTELDATGAILDQTTQAIVGVDDFAMPAPGRLQSKCPTPRHCHIAGTLSMIGAGTNVNYHFALAKNGIIHPPAIMERKMGVGADVGALAVHYVTTLEEDDYISFFVKNIDGTQNLTAKTMNIQLMSEWV